MIKDRDILFILLIGIIYGAIFFLICDAQFHFEKNVKWTEIFSLFIPVLVAWLVSDYIARNVNNSKSIREFFITDLKDIELNLKEIKILFDSHFEIKDFNKRKKNSQKIAKLFAKLNILTDSFDKMLFDRKNFRKMPKITSDLNWKELIFDFKQNITSFSTPENDTIPPIDEERANQEYINFLRKIRSLTIQVVNI